MMPDVLIEIGVKSLALAGVGLALCGLMRHRPARERVMLLRLTLLMLLALPAVALFGPRLGIERPAMLQQIGAIAEVGRVADVGMASASAAPFAAASAAAAESGTSVWVAVLIGAYGLGVGLILSHLAGGLRTLRRWTDGARPLVHPLWGAAYDRAMFRSGVRRKVRLLVTADTPSPLGWGLRRPVILIDPATAARDAEAEAVMAHEMAHVARHDWPMLIVSRIVLALFWFNPLMWLLDRRLSDASEEAADMHAIRRVDRASYAQTLLTSVRLAAGPGLPATPMVGRSNLGRRIRAVLDDPAPGARSGLWTATACTVAMASALTIAALELLPAKPAMAKPAGQPAYAAAPVVAPAARTAAVVAPTEWAVADTAAPAPLLAASVADAVEAAGELPVPPEPPQPPEPPAPFDAPVPPVPPAPPAPVSPPSPPAPPSPPPGAGAWVQVKHMSRVDVMRSMGVTDDYVREMGAAFGRPLANNEIMALKSMGVTPDCVTDWRAAGLPALTAREATQLAAMDVKADYVADIRGVGLGEPSVRELVQLRAMGVTAAFAEDAREAGRAASFRDLVRLKATGWR
jgi:beta-lactamase regulating signal transducer with metallopeptidase domain